MNNKRLTSPPRVLIVDNEPQTVTMYQELIQLWGFLPIVAEGTGTALIEDALLKAKQFRCQVALVDMRLVDDFDDEDTSGLDVIEKIKPTETIIASAYGTLEIAVDTVQNKKAAGFFEKSRNPADLKEKINKIILEKCAYFRDLEFVWSDFLTYSEEVLLAPDIRDDYKDQVYDIFARLFPDAKKLRLEKMNSRHPSAYHSTVPRPKSVILRVFEDDLQPVIIKLARKKKIMVEVGNFNQYIRSRLVGNYVPVLNDYVALWDIGGIKLSYIGSIEETFANFISYQPIHLIKKSLNHFFLETWADHYKKSVKKTNTSLFNLYCDVWGTSWVKRALNFSVPDASEVMSAIDFSKIPCDSPLTFLKAIVQSKSKEDDLSLVEETYTAITHGDLHADNLLVDSSHNSWIVDFERSGEGHAFQDFVELEADIINRIAFSQDEFPAFYHFCLAVAELLPLSELLDKYSSIENKDVLKLLKIIVFIRELSLKSTKISDARQYILGLYFNTIFRATLVPREKYRKSELRTWMLASILCYRLNHWDNSTWPPTVFRLR